MRKLSANLVPKCLNADQKRQSCQSSDQILEFFRRDPDDFLSRLVTMDGTWLYYYDLQTMQWSIEWRHSGSPRPQKFQVQNRLGKFSPRCFGIKTASSSFIIFERANLSTWSITHPSLLVQLKDILKEKRRGKVTKGVLFLHDNTPAHRALATQKKLAYLGCQCLDHPPYSLGLAPSDYHLFPGMKKTIERSPFFIRRRGHCCRGDLVGRTTFWFFFWVACKS